MTSIPTDPTVCAEAPVPVAVQEPGLSMLLMNDTKKEKIVKQVAIHHASVVATAAKKAELPRVQSPSSFATISKAVIELEMMTLQARLLVLEGLEVLNDEEKMELLFHILDKNRDGSLSVVELADGLRKIRGDVGFEESIQLAMDRVAYFDTDGDAKLQYEEFKVYVTKLSESLGTTFHEVAEMLILSVTFNVEDGNDDVDNLLATIVDEDITLALQQTEILTKVMNDDRMKVLFHLFDLDNDGSVDYMEVVLGLYKITHQLDDAATTAFVALLTFDEEGNAKLDYEEFTRFILELMSAMGQTFDEAIFQMTKASAADDTPDEITTKEDFEKILLELGEGTK